MPLIATPKGGGGPDVWPEIGPLLGSRAHPREGRVRPAGPDTCGRTGIRYVMRQIWRLFGGSLP